MALSQHLGVQTLRSMDEAVKEDRGPLTEQNIPPPLVLILWKQRHEA
jgi:hypothetical protein